ncbi:hypothetical protein [Nocardia violaceofusca]|uniref:hypothetical protein n=1 Tax=Nocardia violaceofusca TaxID=941182 RepID=UPI0012F522EF|nr:hypothetical protein [Nocardia violaceofusca]
MRARDMDIGQTYVVLVPHRLPAARYPERERLGTSMWMARLMTGTRFRLTVTSIDLDTDPATAEGWRLIERAHTDIELTDGQAAVLGLSGGQGYRVTQGGRRIGVDRIGGRMSCTRGNASVSASSLLHASSSAVTGSAPSAHPSSSRKPSSSYPAPDVNPCRRGNWVVAQHLPARKLRIATNSTELGQRIERSGAPTSVSLDSQQVRRLQMHQALVRVMVPVDMAQLPGPFRCKFEQIDLTHEFSQLAVCVHKCPVRQCVSWHHRSHSSPHGSDGNSSVTWSSTVIWNLNSEQAPRISSSATFCACSADAW